MFLCCSFHYSILLVFVHLIIVKLTTRAPLTTQKPDEDIDLAVNPDRNANRRPGPRPRPNSGRNWSWTSWSTCVHEDENMFEHRIIVNPICRNKKYIGLYFHLELLYPCYWSFQRQRETNMNSQEEKLEWIEFNGIMCVCVYFSRIVITLKHRNISRIPSFMP